MIQRRWPAHSSGASARMRCWRALKPCGAVLLRDGVYLLPTHSDALAYKALFDRSADFGELFNQILACRVELLKQCRKLRKNLAQLLAIDFFPGEAQRQTTPPLLRLGVLVRSLDVGGVQPPEAAGVERVLTGMREAIADDDQLMQVAAGVFEGLLIAFNSEQAKT